VCTERRATGLGLGFLVALSDVSELCLERAARHWSPWRPRPWRRAPARWRAVAHPGSSTLHTRVAPLSTRGMGAAPLATRAHRCSPHFRLGPVSDRYDSNRHASLKSMSTPNFSEFGLRHPAASAGRQVSDCLALTDEQYVRCGHTANTSTHLPFLLAHANFSGSDSVILIATLLRQEGDLLLLDSSFHRR